MAVSQVDNIDLDKDGKNEEIKVKLTFSGLKDQVKSVLLLQSFKYQIKDKVNAMFKLPIFSVFNMPAGSSKLNAQGILTLN